MVFFFVNSKSTGANQMGDGVNGRKKKRVPNCGRNAATLSHSSCQKRNCIVCNYTDTLDEYHYLVKYPIFLFRNGKIYINISTADIRVSLVNFQKVRIFNNKKVSLLR